MNIPDAMKFLTYSLPVDTLLTIHYKNTIGTKKQTDYVDSQEFTVISSFAHSVSWGSTAYQ